MGKKNRDKKNRDKKKHHAAGSIFAPNGHGEEQGFNGTDRGLTTGTGKRKPRVLFAVGDADFGYTEGKIWHLVRRLRDHTGWDVVGVAHDREVGKKGQQLGLQVWNVEIVSSQVEWQEYYLTVDNMIRQTSDIIISGSDLPLWKILAMDEFKGSLILLGMKLPSSIEADLVVVPLMSVDNNSKGSCAFYTWMVSKAREKGIPVVGLEISPLGNKYTISQLPASRYAVKSEWSRKFLIRQGMAHPSQVSVLKREEAYLLWPGREEYAEAYLEKEPTVREVLKIPPGRFTILIHHHVAFIRDMHRILEALAEVDRNWRQGQEDNSIPFSVVIRVDPRTMRRQYPEREIVLKAYDKELQALPHVIIDETAGVGLLLQLADLVISPFAGTTTERASLYCKPTIICQAMGEEGWEGEFLYWEPNASKIPDLIQDWKDKNLFDRTRLAKIVSDLLENMPSAISHQLSEASSQRSAMSG